jgi:hypothetical protein
MNSKAGKKGATNNGMKLSEVVKDFSSLKMLGMIVSLPLFHLFRVVKNA